MKFSLNAEVMPSAQILKLETFIYHLPGESSHFSPPCQSTRQLQQQQQQQCQGERSTHIASASEGGGRGVQMTRRRTSPRRQRLSQAQSRHRTITVRRAGTHLARHRGPTTRSPASHHPGLPCGACKQAVSDASVGRDALSQFRGGGRPFLAGEASPHPERRWETKGVHHGAALVWSGNTRRPGSRRIEMTRHFFLFEERQYLPFQNERQSKKWLGMPLISTSHVNSRLRKPRRKSCFLHCQTGFEIDSDRSSILFSGPPFARLQQTV